MEYPAGAFPDSLVVVDFDRDGLPDAATSSALVTIVSVLRNRGGGDLSDAQHFGTRYDADAPFFIGSALAVRDINGDGRPDLAAATGTGVSVLLGR